MAFEFAEDCIHLKACRRARKLALKKGIAGGHLTLNCNSETCTAYVSGNDTAFVTVETALRVARDAFGMIRSGYGDYDAIAPQDFDNAQTLGEIIDELQEARHE